VSRIHVVPINEIDPTFLSRLALCLEERFLYEFAVEKSLALSPGSINPTRKQFFLNTIVSKVQAARPGPGHVLALTHFDLYKTSHNFIFGDANEQERIAVVSMHRLRTDFYGEKPDDNVLFQRALKEAVHELGHAFGLKHCYNARCVMYFSNSIYDTDNKLSHFCESCDRRSRAKTQ